MDWLISYKFRKQTSKPAGEDHTLALDKDGSVFSFGSNSYSQLGLNIPDEGDYPPTKIINLPTIKMVSAGLNFSLFLSIDGFVYSVGNNTNGQLGLGNEYHQDNITLIPELYDIVDVVAGTTHSLFLNKYGQVFSCGDNSNGQLGLGNYTDNGLLEYADFDEVGTDEFDINVPTLIYRLENIFIVQIAAYQNHSAFIDKDGNVYVCGTNNNNSLGFEGQGVDIPTLIPNLNLFV